MAQLNLLLEKILDESSIDFCKAYVDYEIDRSHKALNIEKDIKILWEQIPENARVAIYGAGSHTIKLFEMIDSKTKNIVCIVDKLKPNGMIHGYPIIKIEDIHEYNVDLIFISTLGYKEEIKKELIECKLSVKIMDIYEELEKKGYSFTEPFYYQRQHEVYFRIHVIRKLYQETNDFRFLKGLIKYYLDIHDFSNAFCYIDVYVQQKYLDFYLFENLKSNLEQFFIKIKEKLDSKSTNNILMVISDGLRYKDVNEITTPYLFQILKDNIWFENAYTHVPYTHMSLVSMFTGKTCIDDYQYEIGEVPEQTSLFCEISQKKGKFCYLGIKPEIFPKKTRYATVFNTCSSLFWEYICRMYDEDTLDVSCLHSLETHTPFICGKHSVEMLYNYKVFSRDLEGVTKFSWDQYMDTVRYMDQQCEFYFKFFYGNTTILFCSDHGQSFYKDQVTIKNNFWNEDMIRVPYGIISSTGMKKNVSQLFSHLDTGRVILNLINKSDILYKISIPEFVEVNRDFTYSKNDLSCMRTLKCEHLGKAFKCWVSKEDKYVLYYDGTEEYYILPDENTNLIHHKRYQDRIEMYRRTVNRTFPKWKGSRFEYTRQYYKI